MENELIDVNHPEDKELIKAARECSLASRKEKAAKEQKEAARQYIAVLMRERGYDTYQHEDVTIVLETTEKVQVKVEDE